MILDAQTLSKRPIVNAPKVFRDVIRLKPTFHIGPILSDVSTLSRNGARPPALSAREARGMFPIESWFPTPMQEIVTARAPVPPWSRQGRPIDGGRFLPTSSFAATSSRADSRVFGKRSTGSFVRNVYFPFGTARTVTFFTTTILRGRTNEQSRFLSSGSVSLPRSRRRSWKLVMCCRIIFP